jgi:hypothetical protein
LNGGILTLGVPLSMIIERHFSLSIKLTAYIVYMIAWCRVPALFLALGVFELQFRQRSRFPVLDGEPRHELQLDTGWVG